jgi:hypothetical protein
VDRADRRVGSHPRPADSGDRPDLLLGFFSGTEGLGSDLHSWCCFRRRGFVEKLKPLLADQAALKKIPRRECLATRLSLAELFADVPDKQA